MANDDTIHAGWDAFISHASEDKETFVRPLANALVSLGVSVWYDEFTLNIGDSISESIDQGLKKSRYGIVILSRNFMNKSWPKRELKGLVALEISGRGRILPVWHEVEYLEVEQFSPPLADSFAVRTSDAEAVDIALKILKVIRPDLYAAHPRSQLVNLANGQAIAEMQDELARLRRDISEFQCPYCGSYLVSSIQAPIDDQGKHWDTVREFECGFSDFGGEKRQLCPSDPDFPMFDDYELLFTMEMGNPTQWLCYARGKTEGSRAVRLPDTFGTTKEEASEAMRSAYRRKARKIDSL
ncbi:toll/interleukin-1 receptor domain-containing protein [Oleomonas cavernae]|uniref:ADP-ribosyl cyclase/cyclic ADP-ribose hydrolase n=1 Tax=Oleomonas cavernae TaxID=2320859 RepID=A0A418WU54_9PROT|nr:toll/interleukin-1 receptor domain-containing protein [Oleomonas cavernae]RJF94679.1 toll/interleukin-1 receptor domain-containing protein [Oleomonas cavernae]